jgi:predicted GNAT family acetyltransferase
VAADADGDLVGCVFALLTEEVAEIAGLYLRPDYRGNGIATVLTQEVLKVIKDLGRSHAVLTVETPNEKARRLYEKVGFIEYATNMRKELTGAQTGARDSKPQ